MKHQNWERVGPLTERRAKNNMAKSVIDMKLRPFKPKAPGTGPGPPKKSALLWSTGRASKLEAQINKKKKERSKKKKPGKHRTVLPMKKDTQRKEGVWEGGHVQCEFYKGHKRKPIG